MAKRKTPILNSVYYPDDIYELKNLYNKKAQAHAFLIKSCLKKLNCSVEQKQYIIDKIKEISNLKENNK